MKKRLLILIVTILFIGCGSDPWDLENQIIKTHDGRYFRITLGPGVNYKLNPIDSKNIIVRDSLTGKWEEILP